MRLLLILVLCLLTDARLDAQPTDADLITQTKQALRDDPFLGVVFGQVPEGEALIQRIADRMIRSSYQERYHIIVRDEDFRGEIPTTRPSVVLEQRATTPAVPSVDSGNATTVSPGSNRGLLFISLISFAVLFGGLLIYWLNTRRRPVSPPKKGSRRK